MRGKVLPIHCTLKKTNNLWALHVSRDHSLFSCRKIQIQKEEQNDNGFQEVEVRNSAGEGIIVQHHRKIQRRKQKSAYHEKF